MSTPAERLYSLPEPIQAELVELVRRITGMSDQEKADTKQHLSGVGLMWGHFADDSYLPACEVLSSVAGLIIAADRAANPFMKIGGRHGRA